MKTKSATRPPRPPRPLEKGQLWKMKNLNLEVMEVGKLLVRFRLFNLQPRVASSLDSVLRVQVYLKENKARLVPNPRLIKRAKVAVR